MAQLDDFMDELAKICAKEVQELSPLEIGFLNARRSYLSTEHTAKFAEVLKEVKAKSKGKSKKEEELVDETPKTE